MKQYIFIMITLAFVTNASAQETTTHNSLSVEISIGYERTGYIGYQNYLRDGGYGDGDFEILDKNGDNFSLKIKTSKRLNKRNTVFLGIGHAVLQTNANLISGWTAKVLSSEQLLIPVLSTEIGHRYMLKSKAKINVFLENSLELTNTMKAHEYNLQKINLIWTPCIRAEKSLYNSLKLTFEVGYGLGLLNLSNSTFYKLRNNNFALNVGMVKALK